MANIKKVNYKDLFKIDDRYSGVSVLLCPFHMRNYFKIKFLEKKINVEVNTITGYLEGNIKNLSSKKFCTKEDKVLLMYQAFKNKKNILKVFNKVDTNLYFSKVILSQYEEFQEESLFHIDSSNDKIDDLKIIFKEFEDLQEKYNYFNRETILNLITNVKSSKALVLGYTSFNIYEQKFLDLNNVEVLMPKELDLDVEENIKTNNRKDYFSVYSANDKYDEINFVKSKIIENLSEGYNYNDIAIVSNNINEYYQYFKLLFNDIPYKENKEYGQLIKTFINRLSIILNGDKTCSAFINLLKTNLLNINKKDIDFLDNYIYMWDQAEEPFSKVFDLNPKGTNWPLNYYDKKNLDNLNKTKEKVIKSIEKLSSDINEKNPSEILKNIYNYMNKEDVIKKLNIISTNDVKQLIDVFEAVNNVFKDEKMETEEFLFIIEDIFKEKQDSKTIENEVFIDNISNLSTSKKIIYFIGCGEGLVPANYKALKILSDDDIKAIKETRILNHISEQNFLMNKALFTAQDKTIVSYYKLGEDMKIFKQSKIISNILNEYNIKAIDKSSAIYKARSLSTIKKDYAEELSKNICSKEIKEFLNKEDNNFIVNLESALNYKLEKKLDSNLIEKLHNEDLKISPSSIEVFAKCPFSFFCSTSMYLKEREKKQFDRREFGTFVHYILEKIIESHMEDLTIDNTLDYINKYSSKYLEENFGLVSDSLEYIISSMGKNTNVVLKNMLGELKIVKLRPKFFEFSSRDKGDIDTLKLKLDKNNLVIGGIVDRVDVYETDDKYYYRIIDYKTGSKDFRLDDALLGLNLQMLIYLVTIEENSSSLTNKEVVPAGISYYPASVQVLNESEKDLEKARKTKLRSKGIMSREKEVLELLGEEKGNEYMELYTRKDVNLEKTCSATDFDNIINEVKRGLISIGNNIMDGNISIDPIKNNRVDSCQYCYMRGICRFDENVYKYRKITDYKNSEILSKLEGDLNA